jgi:two-component system, OmpR family, alkaline phosphatase synthesis response regulator PhoP
MNKKILLIDDESDIIEFISYSLKQEGFIVFSAQNGTDGVALAKKHKPDLILLDIMMPEMDGVEVCYELRKIEELKNKIIVFLSARNEDFSQIAAFDAGANDYINKPIKPKLLIKKINGLLNISHSYLKSTKEFDQLKNLKIDREAHKIIFEDTELILPKKEFELLSFLASNPKKVFDREEILETVWGNNVIVGDRTIDVHIRKLREKLGNDKIITVKGVGYKINVG